MTAAVAATRRVDVSGDTVVVVTPTYRLEVRVPVSGRARVVTMVRGPQVSAASLGLTAHQTAHQRRPGVMARLLWWAAPKVLRVTGCGGCGASAAPVPVIVSLPVMVAQRRASCEACAIYRKRWGVSWCGTPGPLRLLKRMFIRRRQTDLGCGCLLNLKRLIPWAKCPAGRW